MQLLWDGLIAAFVLIGQGDPQVMDAAWRSLWTSLLAVLIAGVFGVAGGLILARKRFPSRVFWIVSFRAGMSVPTVLIGLVCFSFMSRRGPLGDWDLLYTSWGIVVGEVLLAFPIIVTWTERAVRNLDRRVSETARTLGAGSFRRGWTYLREARQSIVLAFLTAFARCFTELGVAMMVGGNIKLRTRTLATGTALETARGEFERGIAMSLILLAIASILTVAVAYFGREEQPLVSQ